MPGTSTPTPAIHQQVQILSVQESHREVETDEFNPSVRSFHNHVPFQNRPFIALDGEGVNHTQDGPQSYVLLGASSGESVTAKDLSTIQCLQFLMTVKARNPHGLFVAFAFNYDVNMILKDVPHHLLHRIRKAKRTRWGGYAIQYIPSKYFRVTNTHTNETITVYDTFTFFATSFVKACEEYLGKDEPRLVRVRDGKGKRNIFHYNELDSIIKPYMFEELSLMVTLCETLRWTLETAGIFPKSWHGPGAVASALLKREGIRDHKSVNLPGRVRLASQYAYYGGRFEQFKTGHYEGDVYQYDIRSAYPYALTMCPSLTGEWVEREQATDANPFKLYRVIYANVTADLRSINPIPCRNNHRVYYPPMVETWVWGPEYEMLRKWYGNHIQTLSVIEIDDDGTRPFEFVGEMYEQRAEWKRQGNPAQLGLKLSLNSLYGKLAQRVGYNEEKMTAPPYHQLEWAGFVTSVCRAKMLDLMNQHPESIVAVETDGIFSTVPLDIDEGPHLGQMEAEHYDGIMYIQSGVYFKYQDGDWLSGKTRGFANNTLQPAQVLSCVANLDELETTQTRFGGMAQHMGKPTWRRFNTTPQTIQWGGGGKRVHNPSLCTACSTGGQWHDTKCRKPDDYRSQPHTLPWIDGDVNPWQTRDEVFV